MPDTVPITPLTVAMLQQATLWEDPEANRQATARQLAALPSEVDMVVLPETFSTGFSDNMAPMAEEPEGRTLDFAREMAERHKVLFVATWTVRDLQGVYNRMHCVRPDGSYDYYDKAHTFRMSSEAEQLARGRRQVTFEWRGWRIRPAVCYDLRFPIWLRNVWDEQAQRLDYDLMLFCANWPASRYQAWSTLLRARAIENLCYVVGVNRVGTDGVDIAYAGYSAAVDFRGNDIAVCRANRSDVALATLDPQALAHFRQHWPFYLDADTHGLVI